MQVLGVYCVCVLYMLYISFNFDQKWESKLSVHVYSRLIKHFIWPIVAFHCQPHLIFSLDINYYQEGVYKLKIWIFWYYMVVSYLRSYIYEYSPGAVDRTLHDRSAYYSFKCYYHYVCLGCFILYQRDFAIKGPFRDSVKWRKGQFLSCYQQQAQVLKNQ